MSDELIKQFLNYNAEKALFQRGDKIGIAVSGGLDSIVLLDLFDQIKEEWELLLIVLHFDHKLRALSTKDAEFVDDLCAHKKLRLERGKGNVAEWAEKNKMSIEMAARHCRYEFFEKIGHAEQLKIATGHTANDQAETVLHHIVRGTGVDGLKGIPLQRGRFIRPLLFAQRPALEQYAKGRGLRWREDSTNVDETFTRNRIRHTLVPLLQEQFNPQIIKALARLSESALESRQIIQQAGEDAYKSCTNRLPDGKIVLEIDRFLTYLKSLQRLVLQHVFEAFGYNPLSLTFNKLENVLTFLKKQQSGASYQINNDIYLYVSGNEGVFTQNPLRAQETIVIQKVPGRVEIRDGLFLEIMHHTKPLTLKSKNSDYELIDADKLAVPLCVRSYKKADIFYPINGSGKKNVSDFFIDNKVPYVDRLNMPILESAGKIVWICGFRLDDRFKVTEKTKRVYKLTIGTRERKNGF